MGVYNICLAGHSGCGKTTLAQALLKQQGIEAKLDASPEAKAHGLSIDLGIASFKRGEHLINILDAPGFAEFIEELYKGLSVAESAVLVLSAEKGVEVQTEKAWQLIKSFQKPAVVLMNKLDLPTADFMKALESLREKLDGNFVLLQIPIREGGSFAGIVDLIEQKAVYFDKRKGEIPANLTDQVNTEREKLLEALAEVNDELMARFLEGQPISPQEMKAALKEGVKRAVGPQPKLVPVLCGASASALGLDLFLETLLAAMPSFAEVHSSSAQCAALVFNVTSDQYLGRMAFIKIFGGSIAEAASVMNLRNGAKERIRDIYRVFGDKQEKVVNVQAGEIVALAKLSDFALGDTFASEANGAKLKLADFPKPVFSRAVIPETQADEEKMSTALRELVQTKATITFARDDITKEAILSGMGDTQLNIFAERLKNRFGVSVRMNRPRVPYKETIQRIAMGQYKHKKQTGGRGQYGEVYLRVEPLERGKGFEFVDEVKGGVIPQQFIPAVEKGIVETLPQGIVAGYPMTDIRAAVYYGSHHVVDSSEIAFKIAASQAFKLAVQNAAPVLLEPVMRLIIWAPQEFIGDIISSLNGKRGRIVGMEAAGPQPKIDAEAPLAELLDYALELKSLTQGRATFQMEFLRYQVVASEKLAEELLKRERR